MRALALLHSERRKLTKTKCAVLVVLAGCAAPAKPPPPLPPAMLASCEPTVAEPVPPPRPRTVDAIAAWGNRTQLALRLANHRLAACEEQRGSLIRHLTNIFPSLTEIPARR